jgi:hypothetical protein
MNEADQLIINIDNKVKQLVSLRKKDQDEIQILKNKVLELQKTNIDQQQSIIQLEEKIKFIKITKSLEKGKENIDAKQKINEMLREIDKCMGMLNS